MKKKAIVLVVAVFVTGLFLSSCKAQHHSCPAYSQSNQEQPAQNV